MALLKETPENIERLVKQTGLTSDYKARLKALDELKKYDCPQSRDVITRSSKLNKKLIKLQKF